MLPTDKVARKHMPMFSGLLQYFPDALAAVSYHSWESNEHHNPGEPVHWARDKSSDHKDCIIRHMGDLATGIDEVDCLKAVAWRALAALQLAIEAKQNVSPGTKGQTPQTDAEPRSERPAFTEISAAPDPESKPLRFLPSGARRRIDVV